MCPKGWTPYKIENKQECFKFAGKKPARESNSICKQLQAKVPLPLNANQNKDFLNAFKTVSPTAREVSLDLNDVRKEGNFVKSNGQPTLYLNWREGQPNNVKGKGGQDYAVMKVNHGDKQKDGKWWDHNGDITVDLICQFDCSTNSLLQSTTSIANQGKSNLETSISLKFRSVCLSWRAKPSNSSSFVGMGASHLWLSNGKE